MSHKIDDVLEAVLSSYAEHPAIGKIGETHFPKRHLILSALKKLQCVIFPGFFDEKELRNDNIRFYAGQLLEEIRELLKRRDRGDLPRRDPQDPRIPRHGHRGGIRGRSRRIQPGRGDLLLPRHLRDHGQPDRPRTV